MKKIDVGLDLSTQRTRKQVLLDKMKQVMPWSQLLALIAPHVPIVKTGRPPFDLVLDQLTKARHRSNSRIHTAQSPALSSGQVIVIVVAPLEGVVGSGLVM